MSHLDYLPVTDDSFATTAAGTFTAKVVSPGTTELTGPCPRCGAIIRIPVVSGVYKSFRLPRRRHAPPASQALLEPVICTCDDDHPGRPEGDVGCGAFWIFRLEPAAQ
ncbi:hypothetical protein [Streptomyces sp. NPDC018610]|uniref:hypothetical protein n=1 Tax=Streptomyces sp. NPDC018610 TaxID=3365049 RepID=UPI00378B2B97